MSRLAPEEEAAELARLREALRTATDRILEVELAKLRIAVKTGDTQSVSMSLAMLIALTICPAMLSSQEAIRQSQTKTRRDEHRGRRCNLIVSCVKPSTRARDVNNRAVVLRDSKLYISRENLPPDGIDIPDEASPDQGYPFSGYYLPYPDAHYEGLVSTIADDPPQLNWIYVDKDTYEVKHGLRVDAQEHITGPFDCTKSDRRLTLQGWEGFVAVEETPGIWALYFDVDDDGLRSKAPSGMRILDVELIRREKKMPKPEPEENAPTTLDEKMKQHKEQSEQVDPMEESFLNQTATVDRDVGAEKILGLADTIRSMTLADHSTAGVRSSLPPRAESPNEGDKSLSPDEDELEDILSTTYVEHYAHHLGRGTDDDHTIACSLCDSDAHPSPTRGYYKAPSVEDVPEHEVWAH